MHACTHARAHERTPCKQFQNDVSQNLSRECVSANRTSWTIACVSRISRNKYAEIARDRSGDPVDSNEKALTHMSEVDDRDLALAEESLAGLRDDGRAGTAAHFD